MPLDSDFPIRPRVFHFLKILRIRDVHLTSVDLPWYKHLGKILASASKGYTVAGGSPLRGVSGYHETKGKKSPLYSKF